MEEKNTFRSIEIGPGHCKISHKAQSHNIQTEMCLSTLSYVLPVVVDHSVNFTLITHPNLVLSKPSLVVDQKHFSIKGGAKVVRFTDCELQKCLVYLVMVKL